MFEHPARLCVTESRLLRELHEQVMGVQPMPAWILPETLPTHVRGAVRCIQQEQLERLTIFVSATIQSKKRGKGKLGILWNIQRAREAANYRTTTVVFNAVLSCFTVAM